MFAVFKTGGKQYKVAPADILKVEKLEGNVGDNVTFEQVMMVVDGDKMITGSPMVEKAKVTGEIIVQGKDKKVIVFKKRRRQNYRRKNGHRQQITILRVSSIEAPGILVKAEAKKVVSAKKEEVKVEKIAKEASVKAEVKKADSKKTTTAKSAEKKTDKK